MGYIEDLRAIVGHRPLIFVGAVVVIVDEIGRILLQQRTFPNGVWGLPGGLMELGESTEEVAVREVFEETGLTVSELKLINVYSGKDHFIKAANGDEFYVVTVAYYTENFIGELSVDIEESIQAQFLTPNELPSQMVKSHRNILNEFLKKHYKM
ncbi:NUDIX hydrolase [Bacillus sp. 31A1R]|uniref:NUDIX hydrolase n=1 Tax=Robertmurraya mangrovi TaxID=3098077 RepID=A0ABU5J2S5_9BACI|nr:NUDIX hydrolase [Bacillus sp. 31A1R]MDZ5473721.1 NUDIX hydrolase [Bacillus sp. 31A1R]